MKKFNPLIPVFTLLLGIIICLTYVVLYVPDAEIEQYSNDTVTWEKSYIEDTVEYVDECVKCAYTISENGINHIKQYEQCKLTAYWDVNGYSIGWGHHAKDVYKGMTITQYQADDLLTDDLQWASDRANALLEDLPYEYHFSQSFFDGLVSLIYNAGIGNVRKSIFYKRLQACRVINGKINVEDFNYTISSIKTFKCAAKGNKQRRLDEYTLMSYL